VSVTFSGLQMPPEPVLANEVHDELKCFLKFGFWIALCAPEPVLQLPHCEPFPSQVAFQPRDTLFELLWVHNSLHWG